VLRRTAPELRARNRRDGSSQNAAEQRLRARPLRRKHHRRNGRRRRKAALAHLLPDAHFYLNRQSPVETVRDGRNEADIGAKRLAFDSQQGQRRNEPCAIAVVRIAIECAKGDPGADIEACKLPVQGALLVGCIVGPRAIAVDKTAAHQYMVARQQHFGAHADIVVAQTLARVEVV